MDVDELGATLRAMRRVAADEALPPFLRELAEPFVESLGAIFERADGMPPKPKPTPASDNPPPAPPSVTIEQQGERFVVRGDETLARMVQALLSAAAGKQVGPMSGKIFELALELAGRGL